jgi:hypothetical protein
VRRPSNASRYHAGHLQSFHLVLLDSNCTSLLPMIVNILF